MVLRLRAESGRHQHLWLAADGMEEAEWRGLRRILLQRPIRPTLTERRKRGSVEKYSSKASGVVFGHFAENLFTRSVCAHRWIVLVHRFIQRGPTNSCHPQ